MSSNIKLNNIRVDERIPVQFTVGNQHLFGILHLPLVQRPSPAVLICHGLGGDKNGKFRTYVTLASRLAHQGIACFRFDYRGCGDSEGEFDQVTISSQLEDAIKATEWLKRHPLINPDRLGIMGRSFGGLIATHTAFRTKVFKTMAIWSAVFDGHSWQHIWNEITQGIATPDNYTDVMCINGQMSSMQLWQELFLINTSEAMEELTEIPFLNIHGEKDPRVDFSHSGKYANTRKQAPALSQFLKIPEADHDFSNPWEREEALEATIEWFRQTL